MNPEGSPSGRFQAPVGRALEGDMGTPVSPPPHPHPDSLSHLGYGEECDYIRHHDISSVGQLVMFRNFWDKQNEPLLFWSCSTRAFYYSVL